MLWLDSSLPTERGSVGVLTIIGHISALSVNAHRAQAPAHRGCHGLKYRSLEYQGIDACAAVSPNYGKITGQTSGSSYRGAVSRVNGLPAPIVRGVTIVAGCVAKAPPTHKTRE